MEPTEEHPVRSRATSFVAPWQVLWFCLHLAAVYILVKFCTPWFAGWVNRTLLPSLGYGASSSSLFLLFSHLFAFACIPAFIAGLVNAKFRHKTAELVWVVPAVVLVYELIAFQGTSSVLDQNRFLAFHYYFGGAFLLPDAHTYGWGSKAYWEAVGSSPDVGRALAQLKFAAPFYAGIAYSLASWLGIRTELSRRVGEAVNRWEEQRFGKRDSQDEGAV
jgi:hypothetical protein